MAKRPSRSGTPDERLAVVGRAMALGQNGYGVCRAGQPCSRGLPRRSTALVCRTGLPCPSGLPRWSAALTGRCLARSSVAAVVPRSAMLVCRAGCHAGSAVLMRSAVLVCLPRWSAILVWSAVLVYRAGLPYTSAVLLWYAVLVCRAVVVCRDSVVCRVGLPCWYGLPRRSAVPPKSGSSKNPYGGTSQAKHLFLQEMILVNA